MDRRVWILFTFAVLTVAASIYIFYTFGLAK